MGLVDLRILFTYYVCSLYYAIECYLLKADGNELCNNTLMIDIEGFDDVPMGNILKELGKSFSLMKKYINYLLYMEINS